MFGSSNRSARHSASSRRREAKQRQKEHKRARMSEADLAKAADREAKKREKAAGYQSKQQAKAQKREQLRGPAGMIAPLAAIGVVILLVLLGVLAYRLLVKPPKMPPASEATSRVVTATASAASSVAAPAERLLSVNALGIFAPLLRPLKGPLPGNPALAEKLTVAVGGDVMMDRRVSEMIESEGGAAPLEDVAPILKRAEVAIVNLETPLSSRGEAAAGKDVTFRGNPDGIEALVKAGVDVVGLANNHALDYGDVALDDTIDLLDKHKIAHAGAGANAKEAWRAAIIRKKGKSIAYLAWSYIEPGGFVAGDDSAGIAGAKQRTDDIAAAIRKATRQADFVIVSFHWGVEYTDYPIDVQKELAHVSIDAGADMVASHHPHVIQGIEMYKNRLIAYSLGDFVFDHYSRKTGEAFILEATISRTKTLKARAIPVYLNESGKPEVVTGDEADAILSRLKSISEGFGTKMRIAKDVATIDVSEIGVVSP